jgi:hypothetical protein
VPRLSGAPWGHTKPPASAALDPGHPLAQGLRAFWTFADGGRYDLHRGAVAEAVSPATFTGAHRQGAYATNTTGYLSVADSPNLNFTTPYTLACWVLPLNDTDSFRGFINKEGGGGPGYYLGQNGTNIYFGHTVGNNEVQASGVVAGQAMHVVGCFTGTGVTIRKNGVLLASGGNGTVFPQVTTNPVYIGKYGPGDAFAGHISDVGIWGRALTPTEQIALYERPYDLLWRPRGWWFVPTAAGAAQDTPELRGRPFGLRGQTQMRQLLAQ